MNRKPVIAAVSVPISEKNMWLPKVSLDQIKYALNNIDENAIELDLVLLPMFIIGEDDSKAQEKKSHLSKFAKNHNSYLIYNEYKQGYSVSTILDRNGEFLGEYKKTHRIDGIDGELLLGDSFPVFELDFAKVAMLVGSDIYIPEVAEMYSVKGADILLCSMGIEPLRDDTMLQRLLRGRAIEDYMFVAVAMYASDKTMYMCSNFESAHHPTNKAYEGIGESESDFNSNGLGRHTGRAIVYDLRGEVVASTGRECGSAIAYINIAQKHNAKKYMFGTGSIIFHQNERGVFNDLCSKFNSKRKEYPVKNPTISMLHVPYSDTIGGWDAEGCSFNEQKIYAAMEEAASYSDLVVASEYSCPSHNYSDEKAKSYAAIAKKYCCYILVNHEVVTDCRRNTSFLFDRGGKIILKYEKVNGLHFVYDKIPTVGSELPVVDLDFATVGVMVCADSYSQEIPRLLALKGAVLIFLQSQSWGYDAAAINEGQTRAWCIENGIMVFMTNFPSSQVAHRTNVIDQTGETVFASRYDSEGIYSLKVDVEKSIWGPSFVYKKGRVEKVDNFRERLFAARRPELYASLTTNKQNAD